MSDIESQKGTDSPEEPSVPYLLEILVRDFHPVWNVGIVAAALAGTLLYRFPYPANWLRVCGTIMFAIAVIMFFTITVVILLKLYFYPHWKSLDEPQVSSFWGPYSVAFSTMLNMLHYLFENQDHTAIWVLWWVNIFMALFCGWFILLRVFTVAKMEGADIHGMLVLIVLPLVVVASTGALMVPSLGNANSKLITMIVSFLLYSNGVLSGLCIVAVLYWKYITHGLPPNAFVFTLFAPAGLFGHASWGILLQGKNIKEYLSDYQPQISPAIGEMFRFISLPVSLFFLGFGIWFTFLTFGGWVIRGRVPLGKVWFNLTFPLGALSLPFHEVYTLLGFEAFRVVSVVYAVSCLIVVCVSLVSALRAEFPLTKLKKIAASLTYKLT
ncbi:unnamed protein product [Kuraishia capsulata CBS 1993]|uniref:Sulfite efflux pump SSU1 n=1 Tax=Kuraishia capsulata CBS 1993 TaxID=1382522 RepID=W6MJ18_9ASCO|nr:uncharacterized protein KUCA_T00002172001 [Kuraishia capsulata CBS 1993]CDK26201.1 unnamed protein product [Kuraishia capsulata CBS 1993]